MRNISYDERSSSRQLLHKVVPLEHPFTLQAYISHACNFRCYYCLQSQPRDTSRDFPKLGAVMTVEDFCECMDNIRVGGILKKLIFSGVGEPLVNSGLPNMIRYAKKIGVAQKVDVITNGALLNRDLSDALIGAGLDSLRVSLQGINAEQYIKNADVKIDFQEFLQQLKYFFDRRGDCKVIVKIMNEMLENPDDRKEFDVLFGDISDGVFFENVIPTNALEAADTSLFTKDKFGSKNIEIKTCSQPFYTVMLDYNCELYACTQSDHPVGIGNIKTTPITTIWNQGIHKQLLIDMLYHRFDKYRGCSTCNLYRYCAFPEDVLDGHKDEIISRMNKLQGGRTYES